MPVSRPVVAPVAVPCDPPPRRKPACLHLFSGPGDRHDGFSAILRQVGWDSLDVDIANVGEDGDRSSHDLSSDLLWDKLLAPLRQGAFDAVLCGTPCETFSAARHRAPGPPPLRSLDFPYGLPKSQLPPRQFEQVRLGTDFAPQSARFLREAHGLGVGFVIETREPRPGIVSVFTLPEFLALSELGGVRTTAFDQCRFGAESSKPTALLYYRVDLSHLTLRCNHNPIQRQWQDWHGRWTSGFRAHLPLAGRRSPDGTPATKAAAAYPFRMNMELAKAFTSSGRAPLRQPALS